MRKLAMLSGSLKGTVLALAHDSISLGRAQENNIHLDDDDVSRLHALLSFDGQEYRLRDLNSANGTFVNGQRIVETLLLPGDVVKIGLVQMRYDRGPAAAPLTASPAEPRPLAVAAAVAAPAVRDVPGRPPAQPTPPGRAPQPALAPAGPAAAVLPPLSSAIKNLAAGTAPVASRVAGARSERSRSPKRWLWTALVIVDLAFLCWLGSYVRRKHSRELSPASAPHAVAARLPPAAPAATPTYRDPHARFTCRVPDGWTIVEDHGDPRSKVRFVSGDDEIRVIAQETGAAALVETDRQVVLQSFGELIERARETGAQGRVVGSEWRSLGPHRALQTDIEMRPPDYLWMRQVKFRAQGLDHTVALCVAVPERRAALGAVFDRFLETYQSLPQSPRPAVTAAKLTPPAP